MAEFVANCPRCESKAVTFDLYADVWVSTEYNWQTRHEVFAECRHCGRPTIFRFHLRISALKDKFRGDNLIAKIEKSTEAMFAVDGPITVRDAMAQPAPDLIPENIRQVFEEGASSLAAGCYNAAGAMFRLCLDIATKSLLPHEGEEPQPNREQRTKLAFRLAWLFDQGRLPKDLAGLADCVRHDGNDAAHDGTLSQADAEDLLDFATALLERAFTEPGRLKIAEARRAARRAH